MAARGTPRQASDWRTDTRRDGVRHRRQRVPRPASTRQRVLEPMYDCGAKKTYSFDCPVRIDMSGGGAGGSPLFSVPRRQACRQRYAFSVLLWRALVDDLPDPPALVVGDVESTVEALSQACRTMRRAIGLLGGTGEAVGKDFVLRGIYWFPTGESNERHVVSLLRSGRTVPRTVKCDERAVLVMRRELRAAVKEKSVRRPVCRKKCFGPVFTRAVADCLSTIASVLRREHQLSLLAVEITGWPAIVASLLDPQ